MDNATTSVHGLLGTGDPSFRLDRVPVSAELGAFVERHWMTSWDMPAGRSASVTLLPHPCVNLVFDRGQLMISGVGRDRFTYTYQGRGQVFGIKFRPGGFQPFYGGPVAELTDQVRPLSTLWGSAATVFADELAGASGLDGFVAVAERHLRAHWPPPDTEVARVGRIVRALLHDRTVTRVQDVTERFGLSMRTLQRLFQRYVGVSPKWVLKRYRLHEAAALLASGKGGDWTELGYFDQSHFIRDFTRAIGMTPSAYMAALGDHGFGVFPTYV
ncbi:AraC family transcriptional regulator [Allokutzneria sp. A3M-2-11 16]|uniref:helix-turn-helix domain-containing protein n=1 Tax=Allokutzneria sp. A3M-2-11 16 TaxID=2962043 RepID=UPI0020B69039|nr:AraC family transcriptional regulator [Allokutzneria sp. A3M-2-11 16]MCP3802414.1 AraC family transcriptional regulator [Allokutzneria sp. A3M-2-11 16]